MPEGRRRVCFSPVERARNGGGLGHGRGTPIALVGYVSAFHSTADGTTGILLTLRRAEFARLPCDWFESEAHVRASGLEEDDAVYVVGEWRVDGSFIHVWLRPVDAGDSNPGGL